MITIRPIEDVTPIHEELSRWWVAHGWSPVAVPVLNAGLGFVAEEDGRPLAYACLYMSNRGGVSMLEWLVANPDASGKAVISAICRLLPFIANEAKELDYGVMLTTCRQPSLGRLLERCGFHKTDESVSHFVKLIPLEVEA